MASSNAWHGVGRTHRGRVRPTNQDALAIVNHRNLWVVADGMGGHAGGDVASQLAVEAVTQHVDAAADTAPVPDEVLLRDAIASAQTAILAEARARPELKGMGTTIVTLKISQTRTDDGRARATVAHVGDSRAYRFRGTSLDALTEDHSLIEDYVRRRLVSPAQALTHPLRHVLTRALGMPDTSQPDIKVLELQPDDILLLCTDGLTKMMDDRRILHILQTQGMSANQACEALITEALELGGDDNVTVVLVTCTALSSP